MKKMLAFLLIFTLSSNSIFVFAAEPKDVLEEASSYTYIDLGTRTTYGSVEGVRRSVTLLASAIAAMKTCSLEAAEKAADITSSAADLFITDEAFYEFHTHTTEVRLDGQFSHYIIEETVYIYADKDYEELVDVVKHTGESLTPLCLSENK